MAEFGPDDHRTCSALRAAVLEGRLKRERYEIQKPSSLNYCLYIRLEDVLKILQADSSITKSIAWRGATSADTTAWLERLLKHCQPDLFVDIRLVRSAKRLCFLWGQKDLPSNQWIADLFTPPQAASKLLPVSPPLILPRGTEDTPLTVGWTATGATLKRYVVASWDCMSNILAEHDDKDKISIVFEATPGSQVHQELLQQVGVQALRTTWAVLVAWRSTTMRGIWKDMKYVTMFGGRQNKRLRLQDHKKTSAALASNIAQSNIESRDVHILSLDDPAWPQFKEIAVDLAPCNVVIVEVEQGTTAQVRQSAKERMVLVQQLGIPHLSGMLAGVCSGAATRQGPADNERRGTLFMNAGLRACANVQASNGMVTEYAAGAYKRGYAAALGHKVAVRELACAIFQQSSQVLGPKISSRLLSQTQGVESARLTIAGKLCHAAKMHATCNQGVPVHFDTKDSPGGCIITWRQIGEVPNSDFVLPELGMKVSLHDNIMAWLEADQVAHGTLPLASPPQDPMAARFGCALANRAADVTTMKSQIQNNAISWGDVWVVDDPNSDDDLS